MGSAGQFLIVERAIVSGEWPYDNGDDPSFYVARRGGPLTWGVCREDLRNAISIGAIVVFFPFTSKGRKIFYKLSAIGTVADTLDRRDVFKEERFRRFRALYLNTLIQPADGGWRHDEGDRNTKAQHRDWLWRIAVHGRVKKKFKAANRRIYETGRLGAKNIQLARNYVVFSSASDETYISSNPPRVALAIRGRNEEWNDRELRRLTVEKAGSIHKSGRDYLRIANPTNRHVHRHLRFALPAAEARERRRSLIAALKERDARC
jgi:hypothetical protein